MEKGRPLRAVGITCGVGSMLVGARDAGFEVQGNIEWRRYYSRTDDQGRRTFTENFPGTVLRYKVDECTDEELERLTGCDIALGYNGFPAGVDDSPERYEDRAVKYRLVQHAERNVLDNARFDAQGATLYVTFFPCAACARSIVSKGVARVVCPPPPHRAPWSEDAPFVRLMFSEAGVQLDTIVEGDELPGPGIRL